jgi:cell shape-determining protein MreD
MSDNGRVSLLFFFNILLYFFIGMVNNKVSGFSVHLHLEVLIISFPGIYLTRLSGGFFTAVLGLLMDAVNPVPIGTYLFGCLGIWLFFVWCQRRIRRQNKVHVRSVAMVAQLVWILLIGLFLGRGLMGDWVYWQRLLVDTALSCLVVYVFAWPWCRFQKNLLYSLGWDLEAQISAR